MPNVPAIFAQAVAVPEDRDAAILTCITAVGVHLGRRSALVHNGTAIYPILYSLIITQHSTLAAWYRWFGVLKHPPPVTRSGIFNAEALVHLVRDPVIRPDKVFTGKNADPEWRNTIIDDGVTEKRRLIMQRLGPELASRTSATTRRLRDTLVAGYEDGEMSVYVGYRDGGFHQGTDTHVALLVPEPDGRIAAAACDHMPFLAARADHTPVDVDFSGPMRSDVLSQIETATVNVKSHVTIASDTSKFLQCERWSKHPYALLTLLRVGHILAVLERSPVVTESLLLRARAIVEASESVVESLRQGQHTVLREEILEWVRAAGPRGIPHHQLVRRFRRRGHSADEIKNALDELERGSELLRKCVEGRGRYGVVWHCPVEQ